MNRIITFNSAHMRVTAGELFERCSFGRGIGAWDVGAPAIGLSLNVGSATVLAPGRNGLEIKLRNPGGACFFVGILASIVGVEYAIGGTAVALTLVSLGALLFYPRLSDLQ